MRMVSVSFNVYVSSKIGSEAMGLLTLTGGIYAFAITVATSGINIAVVRLVSASLPYKSPEHFDTRSNICVKRIMKNAIFYCLIFSVTASIILFISSENIGKYLLRDVRTVPSLRLMSFSLVPISISSALNGYFSAVRRVYKNVIVQFCEQGAKILVVSILLVTIAPAGLEYACIAVVSGGALSEGVCVIISMLLYLNDRKRHYQKKQKNIEDVCKKGCFFVEKNRIRNEEINVFPIALPVGISAYVRSALTTIEHLAIPWGLRKYGLDTSASLSSYGILHGTVLPILLFPSAEMINVYGAFAAVNKNFALGKDRDGHSIDPIRLRTFATNIPNQKFYISSASDTSTKFYKLYREFSKKQIMGDRDYCVIQVDCDVVLQPTIHGEAVNALLSKNTIESEMRTNPEKARREYYCQFTSDAGALAIVRRGTIARNSETRVPLLYNDTNKRKFVIAYDPARSRDNSIILVMEIYLDDTTQEYKGRIVNCVNLVDIGKKRKTPMQTPDQIKYLKELILAYNGDAPDYENIEAIMIDAGSGGGGVNIADYLMEDWIDDQGVTHKGLIDKEYSADYVSKYPNAIDKVKLMSPSQYKSMMCEALIEMMNMNLITFTADYDHKGYLTVFETDEKELNKEKKRIENDLRNKGISEEELPMKIQEELKNASCIKTKMVKLDPYQEIALSNIDALKEEMVNIVRKKRDSGKDSFDLMPEKQNKLHDDRFYCACLCAYCLSEKRRENIIKRKPIEDLEQFFEFKRPKATHSYFN